APPPGPRRVDAPEPPGRAGAPDGPDELSLLPSPRSRIRVDLGLPEDDFDRLLDAAPAEGGASAEEGAPAGGSASAGGSGTQPPRRPRDPGSRGGGGGRRAGPGSPTAGARGAAVVSPS